ncbi:3-octaprenyl-4-hydroxybenzoate carboxy-lyase [Hydrogenobacter thermophilus TK-6]|uniref:Flavin prenyltransferase UbiX n=1 Tax=Hydrogenobacter thermophilus (strain DSM 6534 / IAM 12695 / TK-6) TaxID=608538 RepID=D3DF71_HYDTT|nr:UbiX family flavin prenyltransferase [Hydrogenobacter thermophilus]ADO44417.1 3-octaprenyl-4-hydroxybenzoate carboxy-lyase [Hydrogenobacter thermophilus TK-6]BAI68473.1 3-octaprenyl-4-hydroxybenzoate carboxy-lyase [Hydrogenobacter thermophilus TK-6]
MKEDILLCITGASGSIYGYRLLEVLYESFHVHLVISPSGSLVMKEELGLGREDLLKRFPRLHLIPHSKVDSEVASGSRLINYRGVIVAPCSMSTLACIANGINQNLIHRSCEVALKERVPLVLLLREMPYSIIHIENMLKVAKAGAVVMSASPGFYHKPKSLQELVDFVVGKVLDSLGIDHHLYQRWKA